MNNEVRHSTSGGNMSFLIAFKALGLPPVSHGSNLILIFIVVFVILGIGIDVYWTGRNRAWYKSLRKKKQALAQREEDISNREEELLQDKAMWEKELARLVMENDSLKEIIDRIGKSKIDNTNDAATISEYLGIFKDLNTGSEHLTQIILYGENKLEVLLQDLLRFKPDKDN